jgi:hypothetical protein
LTNLRIVVGGFGGLGNDCAIGAIGTDGASGASGVIGSGIGTGTGIDGLGIGFGALPRSRSCFHASYGAILLFSYPRPW